MIVFGGRGFSPRRISIRKHDRPMAIEKARRRRRCFYLFSFDVASSDRLNAFKSVRPKHARN
jgi:hypothetical protein